MARLVKVTMNELTDQEIEELAIQCEVDDPQHALELRRLFPGNRIDGKQTINGVRGCNRRIADRFDLTFVETRNQRISRPWTYSLT